MKVLKVVLEGVTTSFRYPHFLVGRQPSLPLPPPSTIYGHIAGALGYYPDPRSLEFAYSFSCAGSCDDLETQHILSISTGSLDKKWGYIKNLEGGANPAYRQVLLFPRLNLYVKATNLDEYYRAFREPRYAVILGRSQDLATYTEVSLIELEAGSEGYLEGTLLPNSFRQERTNAGILIQLPRFINPNNRGEVEWQMYLAIEKAVLADQNSTNARSARRLWTEGAELWADTSSLSREAKPCLLYFHSFVETGVTANV
jgi:CRISPR-associated protein Cas5t